MQVELIAITQYLRGDGTPEELLEHAGRVCYRSDSHGNPGAFIAARIKAGHESIIEHASATFEISGISRACSHQLVRHRLASFSQESQRYVEVAGLEQEAVMPHSVYENEDSAETWYAAMQDIERAYQRLLAAGIPKEDARFLLPNATPTRLVVTMNFRELRHFFTVRLHPAAQWEIRELAQRMLELVRPYAPSVFTDFEVE